MSYFVKQTLDPINQSINQTMLRFSPLTVDMMISQLNPHSTGGSVDTSIQRIRGFYNDMRYINPRFTYLLFTYLLTSVAVLA